MQLAKSVRKPDLHQYSNTYLLGGDFNKAAKRKRREGEKDRKKGKRVSCRNKQHTDLKQRLPR